LKGYSRRKREILRPASGAGISALPYDSLGISWLGILRPASGPGISQLEDPEASCCCRHIMTVAVWPGGFGAPLGY